MCQPAFVGILCLVGDLLLLDQMFALDAISKEKHFCVQCGHMCDVEYTSREASTNCEDAQCRPDAVAVAILIAEREASMALCLRDVMSRRGGVMCRKRAT